MEWIYYISVIFGLIEMLCSDYEMLRIDAIKKGQRITELEFLIMKTVLSFIPIVNTWRAVRFLYKIIVR